MQPGANRMPIVNGHRLKGVNMETTHTQLFPFR